MSTLAWLASYGIVTGLALCALGVIFVPLERCFQARRQPPLRPEWSTDLAFFAGQHLVWTGATLAVLSAIATCWHSVAPHALFVAFAQLPFWRQAAIAIVLGDLLLYFGHRAQHHVPWLWRYHRVHHTAVHLDWLAAFREHPLDGLYTRTLVNLPAIALGFPLETLAGLFAFRGLWAVLIHSNVRLSPGPLKYLLGSPHLHLWHHAHTHGPGHNFANLCPWLDVAFGTYREPAGDPERLGAEGSCARSYLEHLCRPFSALEADPVQAPVVLADAEPGADWRVVTRDVQRTVLG